jgi:hypothetical protein
MSPIVRTLSVQWRLAPDAGRHSCWSSLLATVLQVRQCPRESWVTLRARGVNAKSSMGDAGISLGDADISLGDAKRPDGRAVDPCCKGGRRTHVEHAQHHFGGGAAAAQLGEDGGELPRGDLLRVQHHPGVHRLPLVLHEEYRHEEVEGIDLVLVVRGLLALLQVAATAAAGAEPPHPACGAASGEQRERDMSNCEKRR